MLEKIPIYELPFHKNAKLEFKIYKVKGREIQRKDYPHKTNLPHKHNYFELCIFTKGSGKHEIDFCTYEIKAPSIHLLKPGQVHLIRRGDEYEGYLFVFSEELYNLRFKGLGGIPGYPLVSILKDGPILHMTNEEFKDFSALIFSIENEFLRKSEESEEIIISYLNIFLLRLRSKFVSLSSEQGSTRDPVPQLAYLFNELVEKHFIEVKQVNEYAEILGVSPVVLNKTVKNFTGKTASELIINRLMLEAKRLLIYSDLSNKEIAFKLNYEDPSYFTRIFHKKTSSTPTDFRNEMRNHYKNW